MGVTRNPTIVCPNISINDSIMPIRSALNDKRDILSNES